jgi:hypothetical protein
MNAILFTFVVGAVVVAIGVDVVGVVGWLRRRAR